MDGLIIGIISVVVSILIGFVLAPYLNKKGFINQENLETTKQLLEISKVILKNSNIKNKEITTTVLDVSSISVKYIEQTAKYQDAITKKKLAREAIIDTLKTMHIKITPDIEKVIEMGIESAVNSLPKTY